MDVLSAQVPLPRQVGGLALDLHGVNRAGSLFLGSRRHGGLLLGLGEMLAIDPSTMVRDHAVDANAYFAGTGPKAARLDYSHLKTALAVAGGKHAARALTGLPQSPSW